MNIEEFKKQFEENRSQLETFIQILNKDERLCILGKLKEYEKLHIEKGDYNDMRQYYVSEVAKLLSKTKYSGSLRTMVLTYLKKGPLPLGKDMIEKALQGDEFGFQECSELFRILKEKVNKHE